MKNRINTSNVSITPVLGGASGDNYNLLGNPYTSYINSTTLITSKPKDLGFTFWLWNGNGYNTKTTGIHPNYMIAPGQAFFVEAKSQARLLLMKQFKAIMLQIHFRNLQDQNYY